MALRTELPGRFDVWRDSSSRLCGWILQKIQHMTQAAAAGRKWHVLKRIMVIAWIKVTLLRVINERGQLWQSCGVECESQWRKIPADLSGHYFSHSRWLGQTSSSDVHLPSSDNAGVKCDTDEHEYLFNQHDIKTDPVCHLHFIP